MPQVKRGLVGRVVGATTFRQCSTGDANREALTALIGGPKTTRFRLVSCFFFMAEIYVKLWPTSPG